MPRTYHVHVHREGLEYLLTLPRGRRDKVLSALDVLAADPYAAGDFTERDPIGRELRGIVLHNDAIVFWSDHLASEVRVVSIRRADD